jgi:hypothetical protein
MNSEPTSNQFYIWGIDSAAYGPIELPTLVNWIKDERVLAETWIYAERNTTWQRASELPELRMFFGKKPEATAGDSSPPIQAGALRRVKILASLSDDQLTRFARFMQICEAKQFNTLVTQGDHGDAMYLILEGELRVRLLIGGRETILATLGAGDFFGEISLFDHGPRSADIIANKDSYLLKVTAAGCQALTNEAPDIATAFYFGVGRTLAARIRADNKRLSDSVSFAHAAGI